MRALLPAPSATGSAAPTVPSHMPISATWEWVNAPVVCQATGMFTATLGVTLDEALGRLRLHATTDDRHLPDIAHATLHLDTGYLPLNACISKLASRRNGGGVL